VHAALEPVVLQAIHHIFTNSIMEFYEEVNQNLSRFMGLSHKIDLLMKKEAPFFFRSRFPLELE
jgi:hypothetical protein